MERNNFENAVDLLKYLDSNQKISNPNEKEKELISWCKANGYVETIFSRENMNEVIVSQEYDSPKITPLGMDFIRNK